MSYAYATHIQAHTLTGTETDRGTQGTQGTQGKGKHRETLGVTVVPLWL